MYHNAPLPPQFATCSQELVSPDQTSRWSTDKCSKPLAAYSFSPTNGESDSWTKELRTQRWIRTKWVPATPCKDSLLCANIKYISHFCCQTVLINSKVKAYWLSRREHGLCIHLSFSSANPLFIFAFFGQKEEEVIHSGLRLIITCYIFFNPLSIRHRLEQSTGWCCHCTGVTHFCHTHLTHPSHCICIIHQVVEVASFTFLFSIFPTSFSLFLCT